MKPFDVFLSHAGEDKLTFVRPLADRLSNLGLNVAYDEFTFRAGDSLIESIDRGIADSNAGVLVLSEHFFVKPWTHHEKNGLVNRMVVEEDFTLVPVWLSVGREQVAAFSPTLADRIALVTSELTIDEIAVKLVERLRPDLFSAISRRAAYELARSVAEVQRVPIASIAQGPIRHERLPTSYLNRIRVITGVFESVSHLPFDSVLDLYQRDMYPDIELRVWERMAACYLAACRDTEAGDPVRRVVYEALLGLSLSSTEAASKIESLPPTVRGKLLTEIAFKPPWEADVGIEADS